MQMFFNQVQMFVNGFMFLNDFDAEQEAILLQMRHFQMHLHLNTSQKSKVSNKIEFKESVNKWKLAF